MKTKLAKSEVVQRMAENEALIAMGAKQNFESILNIAMGLNGMVELAKEVGWKALGYQNQEDYTVTRWHMAHSQAAKYLDVAKRLPKNFFHSVEMSSKASLGRLLSLLPNDQTEFKLTPEEVEELMLLPPDEFKKELAEIAGYDRSKHGGRGPSDIERPRISRDRYRDQQKKITRLREKYDTTLNEKDELIGEIEKMEKRIEDLKRVTSPDKNKNELIQENKNLLLKLAELEKLVDADKVLNFVGESGMRYALESISECSIIFGKLSKIELRSHEQWVEFRAYTETIRQLLETCEERIAVTMAEKGLHPKEYEQWHDGSFKYHMDKATENMRKDHAEKTEKETDEMIEKAKEDRKKRKKK